MLDMEVEKDTSVNKFREYFLCLPPPPLPTPARDDRGHPTHK